MRNLNGYWRNTNANTFDNLEEMDNFLETYSLPKVNQEETDHLDPLAVQREN